MKRNKFFLNRAGAKIRYVVEGHGMPIVMLHGNHQTGEYLRNQIDYFKQFYQVITIDSRGHGDSSYDQEALTLKLLADDVRAVMDALALEKVYCLGFSDGGNVAMLLALMVPERIKALVLVGVNLYPNGLKFFTKILIQIGYFFAHQLSVIPYFRKKAQLLSLMAIEPNMDPEMLNYIKMPTLLLFGENDIIEQRHIALIYESLENAQLVILPHGNHMLLSQRSKEVNKIIDQFLT